MELSEVSESDFRHVKWKNGLGWTIEIIPFSHTKELWRLSSATVDSNGPFSYFKGYDRLITVIDSSTPLAPEQLIIKHPERGTQVELAMKQFYRFSGDWMTEGILGESVSKVFDLNLIYKRDRINVSQWKVLSKDDILHFNANSTVLFLCWKGEIVITGIKPETFNLKAKRLVSCLSPHSFTVRILDCFPDTLAFVFEIQTMPLNKL